VQARADRRASSQEIATVALWFESIVIEQVPSALPAQAPPQVTDPPLSSGLKVMVTLVPAG
jgi:hypothetical protein